MLTLREHGFNNKEIAEKTGFSVTTVVKYIGHQPAMLRADWGEYTARVTTGGAGVVV
jgi:hypothetical protein